MIFLLGFLVVYIVLMGVLIVGQSRAPNATLTIEGPFPKVSIVVSARNEAHQISALIAAIHAQTYPKDQLELIIVDDRSTDTTREVIAQAAQQHDYIRYLRVSEGVPGWGPKKWALTQGIKAAKNEIILQTDADCRPNENWVSSMMAGFADPKVGFVCGPAIIESKNPRLSPYFVLDSLVPQAFIAAALRFQWPLSCTGQNLGFRRGLFMALNGYEGIHSYRSGDDDLWMHKVGSTRQVKFWYNDSHWGHVYSDAPESMKEICIQRLRYMSKSLTYFKQKTPGSVLLILPTTYLMNLLCVISIFLVLKWPYITLLIWVTRSGLDGVLVQQFLKKIQYPVSRRVFWVTSLCHPFYYVIIGFLGPILGPLAVRGWKQGALPRMRQA